MKRFLFATDFSKASENAFLYTQKLVWGRDIKVDIINVYDLPLSYSTQTPSRAIQGYLHELKAAATKRLSDLMEQLPATNRGVLHPVYGIYPSSEIEEMADDIDADLIIMALREDYGIVMRLIGNTTAKTIHKSDIPVLAIPAKARYTSIRDILFPTALGSKKELAPKEKEAIKWLNQWSGFLDHPNIELLHIIDDGDLSAIDVKMAKQYLGDLNMTYTHALTVEEGIYSYMVKKTPHLLAFYKPHRTFWERLYRPAKTRHLLYDSMVPLIIFG